MRSFLEKVNSVMNLEKHLSYKVLHAVSFFLDPLAVAIGIIRTLAIMEGYNEGLTQW